MSDFLQTINRITTVANEIAAIAGQFSGQPVAGQPAPGPVVLPPVAPVMTPDRTAWSRPATNLPATPTPAPASAPAGFMEVLSGWISGLVSFVKRLFSGGTAPTASGTVPTTASMTNARPVAMADAREQLFAMMPTGQATVYGFVNVTVSRQSDRIVVSAGSFGQVSVYKQGGEYYYQDRDKAPAKVSAVSSTVNAAGDMRFAITLEGGKQIEADILADGRTLRFDKYSLSLR